MFKCQFQLGIKFTLKKKVTFIFITKPYSLLGKHKLVFFSFYYFLDRSLVGVKTSQWYLNTSIIPFLYKSCLHLHSHCFYSYKYISNPLWILFLQGQFLIALSFNLFKTHLLQDQHLWGLVSHVLFSLVYSLNPTIY